MILSDTSIKKHLEKGEIKITPDFKYSNIRPTGIRLHLNQEILIPKNDIVIDLSHPKKDLYSKHNIINNQFILKPQQMILASSIEQIKTNNKLVCFIDGRSTIARLGVFVHCSSTTFDNIHNEERSVVFEIYNCGKFSIILDYEMPIGLLSFIKLLSPIYQNSQDQYQNQKTVLQPNLNFKNIK